MSPQKKPRIKMIVTDIDGTVLNCKNECGEKLRSTLDKIRERGVKVVLATGRMYEGAYPVAEQIGLKTPIICCQGSEVRHYDKVLWQRPLKNEYVREVIQILRDKNIHTNLYNDGLLIVEDERYMDYYCHGRFVTYELVDSLDNVKLGKVGKLLATIMKEEQMQSLIKELNEKYKGKLSVVRSHKHFCEITDIEATKGNALCFLAEYYGISPEEVMASGDQDNDYEMIKAAGIGVAMGNASKKLKEAADYICPCIDEDGLAEAIERFVIKEWDE